MQPAARLGDTVVCLCKCKKKRCPNGQIITASPDTFIEGRPAARLGDLASNCCGSCCPCPNVIVEGAPQTYVNGRGLARLLDRVTCGIIVESAHSTYVH